jgi:DNA topoisomerase-1
MLPRGPRLVTRGFPLSLSLMARVALQELDHDAVDPAASARAAGLRYVDDHRPGLRRRRTGKKVKQGRRWIEAFVIADDAGHVVRDAATLERVRKLAVPPAWRDVWICPFAEGHLQATGRDARRRKQYRYHPRWREERDGTKYARMIALGHALPGLRRRVAADLRRPGLPREKVLATLARLLETTFIRVGNEEYARSNKSFGLTTLKDRHVQIGQKKVHFRFRGKSGVEHQISVEDPTLSRIVRRCRDLPGQELFQYVDEDGDPATIDSADVNDYIRDAAGDDFTAKDFRTWAGTVLAAIALARQGPAPRAGSRAVRRTNRDVARAISDVARRLGNTLAVCRRCYVHPAIIASYLDGALPAALAARSDVRPARAAAGLRSEEAAVLRLLERREAEDRRGTTLGRQLRRSLRLVRGGKRSGRSRRGRARARSRLADAVRRHMSH